MELNQTEEFAKVLQFIDKMKQNNITDPKKIEEMLNQEDDEVFMQFVESVLALAVKYTLVGGGLVYFISEVLDKNILEDILLQKDNIIKKRKILTSVVIGILFETTQLRDMYGNTDNSQSNQE